MSADRDRAVLDAMVRDACEAQAIKGLMPTPEDVRREVVPIVEQLQFKQARHSAATPATGPTGSRASRSKRDGAVEREYERRTGRKLEGEYGIDRNPAPRMAQPIKRSEGVQMVIDRLRLLKQFPDWAEKIKSVNPLAAAGTLGPEKKREAEHRYRQILAASERLFGPIFKERERKITVS